MSIHYKCFTEAKVHTKATPGEALKIIRELQDFSKKNLAKITVITRSNIYALEHGSAQMTRATAIKLAKALHVHPAVLLFPDYDIQKAA